MSIFKNPMVLYSIGHRLLLNNHKLLAKIISLFKRLIFSCNDIPITAEIGEGTQFPHRGIGVIIHGNAKIGKGCKIETNVVIGGRNGRGAPTIGDYCFLGAGCCIIGDITIGNDVMIGANAVVLKSVPDGSVVVGVPGEIIKKVPCEKLGKFKD